MVTTPLVQLSVAMPRVLSSMMPTAVAYADAQEARGDDAMPAAATAPTTTMFVNPWLGGDLCGVVGNPGSTNGTTITGFAMKRIHPGRLEEPT